MVLAKRQVATRGSAAVDAYPYERILVTGGAGFIGSAFVRHMANAGRAEVTVLDALTYAGNLDNLSSVSDSVKVVHGDIRDRDTVQAVVEAVQPQAIVHFAAESHVDRSITGPEVFVDTNVAGTLNLLEAARRVWQAPASAGGAMSTDCRFLHVSTDEVYGALGPHDPPFTQASPYRPNSPYAASKAASDHLVRAYHVTHGLPTLTTHCGNNYGPYQFPEKLIPFMTLNGLAGKPMPVYGTGNQVRDWIHVDDHCTALELVLQAGQPGDTINVGADQEQSNLNVIAGICEALERYAPRDGGTPYADLVTHVADRPGHDFRYALDASPLRDLGWQPSRSFEDGLADTVSWYIQNAEWRDRVVSGAYARQPAFACDESFPPHRGPEASAPGASGASAAASEVRP